jgi:hypothetical protein
MNLKIIGMLTAMAAVGVMACTSETTTSAPDDTDTGTGVDTDTDTDTPTETETDTETETETALTGDCAESFCVGEPADNTCFLCLQEAAMSTEANGGCQEPWLACAQDTECAAFFGGSGGSYDDPLVQDVGNCMCQPGVCLDE